MKFVLAAAGAAFLAWCVIETSAVDVFLRRQPAVAVAVSPDHPRVRMALAMAEFRATQGRLSEEGRRKAIAALADWPLAEEPFYLAGVHATAQGQGDLGEKLLVEARRRNPRARTARLILLDRYLRQNRIADAGIEIAALNRLVPKAADRLIPELTKMVREPKSGAALIEVLAHEPALQQAVLGNLAASGADPDLVLRIAASSAATSPTRDGLPWQRSLLAKMVENGDVLRAHRLWRGFTGLPAGGDEKGLYDGRFEGLPGGPPFNWQLVSGAAGVAERIKGPALQVEYYGRDNVELASQLLLLRPGRYRLQLRAQGDAKGEGSNLVWTVGCLGKESILSLPLKEVDYTPRNLAALFAVPAGCGAQWLRLRGVSGEFARAQSATISDVRIEAAK